MKILKVKKVDARPSTRVRVEGQVFVEVYKDGARGWYYKITGPNINFTSKEFSQDQVKAVMAGEAHARRFITQIRK